MKSKMCEMFGIEAPIFAFSHCRDVVVEVSKAGGLGVLGMARQNPERLREELRWIDDHIQGKPYGIDVLMPNTYQDPEGLKLEPERLLPKRHLDFVRKMLDDAGVPPLPRGEADAITKELVERMSFTPAESAQMIEVAMEHPIKLIVSALGTPPTDIIERAHARGIRIAALAGSAKHALRHKAAACDFVVAVGTEAAGHTGNITSLVLWPQIVDAVAPLPVLGAGGVGRGRQLAAALALGCEGVWCGSIWLKTAQSEVLPETKTKMFAAGSEDAVLTRSLTGKQARMLRSKFIEAFEAPGAPPILPLPLQAILWTGQARPRIERVRAAEFLSHPVGQIVGDMKEECSVKQVVYDMLNELVESKERLDQMVA